MNVKDCIAIVTGGASGLGEACVRELVRNDAKAAIFDLQEERGKKLAAELGGNCLFVKTDVINEESTKESIAKTLAAFGEINSAINCAGIGDACKVLSKRGPYPLNAFAMIVQLNLVGTFNVIRLAVEQMAKNTPNDDDERGVIINTASAAAFEGQIGQAGYSASKAGVVGMTLPIARECASYCIRVMTIAPGLFRTPMLELLPQDMLNSLGQGVPFPKRLGNPSEFAMLVRQIIENPMLNGEVIRLDGALRMTAK